MALNFQLSSPSHFQTPKRKLKLSSVTDFSSPTSPTFSSPLSSAQARRRSQYKNLSPSIGPSGPTSTFKRKPSILFTNQSEKERARQKFQARCFAHAAKARKSVVTKKRHQNSPGDEDEYMDDDDSDKDEDIMQDELFRRVVTSNNSRARHNYVISYEQEVGSDDLADVDCWEEELTDCTSSSACPDMTPEEREIAELEAYAAECERQATETDYDDIPPEFFLDDDDADDVVDATQDLDASMDTS